MIYPGSVSIELNCGPPHSCLRIAWWYGKTHVYTSLNLWPECLLPWQQNRCPWLQHLSAPFCSKIFHKVVSIQHFTSFPSLPYFLIYPFQGFLPSTPLMTSTPHAIGRSISGLIWVDYSRTSLPPFWKTVFTWIAKCHMPSFLLPRRCSSSASSPPQNTEEPRVSCRPSCPLHLPLSDLI